MEETPERNGGKTENGSKTGKVKVIFRLSEEGKRRMIIRGGAATVVQERILDAEMTEEILSFSKITSSGMALMDFNNHVPVAGVFVVKYPPVDEPIETVEDALSHARKLAEMIEVARGKAIARDERMAQVKADRVQKEKDDFEEYKKAKVEYIEKKYAIVAWKTLKEFKGTDVVAFDDLIKEFEEDCRRKERERKIMKAEAEKREWILAFGSPRLKNALEAGESCQEQYAVERVSLEFGRGWYIDFEGKMQFEPMGTPSYNAYLMARDLDSRGVPSMMVWINYDFAAIVESPKPDVVDPFDVTTWGKEEHVRNATGCEAVMVEGFLGHYNLFYPIGPKALPKQRAEITL